MIVNGGSGSRIVFAAGPFPITTSSVKSSMTVVQHFLDDPIEAVNLVNEEHVAAAHVRRDSGQVALSLDGRSGGGPDPRSQLVGDDVGESGFAEARCPMQEDVIERLLTLTCRLDGDAELLLHPRLVDELVVVQPPRGAG